VAKLCSQLGLTLETRDEAVVVTERRQHTFQANALLEPACRVARRFERLCHPAHAETTNQVVGTKLSWLTGHSLED
jgi:hypothetical protein